MSTRNLLSIALLAALFAGCTAPAATEESLAASSTDAAPPAEAAAEFVPVEEKPCVHAEASNATDPAERRAEEKTEKAWATC